jgi:hypothetical protein
MVHARIEEEISCSRNDADQRYSAGKEAKASLWAVFIFGHLVQEILSAPPSQCMAPLSMTSKAAFNTEEMGSEVERIDVGVQISPSKKRVQTRRVFISWLH